MQPDRRAGSGLLITADGGGSNGCRLRQWKMELQGFADGAGLSIMVCHFPPGTSKWNKVEHRLFSFDFIKIHRTLRVAPAMAAGVTDRLFDVSDLVALLIEAESQKAA